MGAWIHEQTRFDGPNSIITPCSFPIPRGCEKASRAPRRGAEKYPRPEGEEVKKCQSSYLR